MTSYPAEVLLALDHEDEPRPIPWSPSSLRLTCTAKIASALPHRVFLSPLRDFADGRHMDFSMAMLSHVEIAANKDGSRKKQESKDDVVKMPIAQYLVSPSSEPRAEYRSWQSK